MLSIKLVKKHKYYIFLLLIGVILSVFYYFNTSHQGMQWTDYYHYYTDSVVITYHLKELNLSAALETYLNSLVNKIILFRTVPFFLIFGPSHFLFSYSTFFYNYLLLIFLFYALTKIMDIKKAFLFTLFILSNSFFLEFLNFFYVDLNYFLACSIFFVYLIIFKDNYKKHNFLIAFLVFLLFLTKNVSYILVPILCFFMVLYFFFTKKKERYQYISRLFLIMFFGFLFYFLMAFGFNFIFFYKETFSSYNGLFKLVWSPYFIHKFSNTFFIFSLYILFIYNLLRRSNLFFVFLFFIGEFFWIFFFLFFIFGYYSIRHFFAFYLIYLFFFFDFIYSLIKRIFKKRYNYAIFLLILILFTYNFFNFFIIKKISFEYESTGEIINSPLYNIAFFLESSPVNKKTIFISTDGNDFFGGVPFESSYNFVSGKNYSDNVLSYLKELEPLYWFQIIDSFYPFDPYAGPANRNPETDYVICIDCSSLNLTNFDLDFNYSYSEPVHYYDSNSEEYVVSVYKNKNFNSTKENFKYR